MEAAEESHQDQQEGGILRSIQPKGPNPGLQTRKDAWEWSTADQKGAVVSETARTDLECTKAATPKQQQTRLQIAPEGEHPMAQRTQLPSQQGAKGIADPPL